MDGKKKRELFQCQQHKRLHQAAVHGERLLAQRAQPHARHQRQRYGDDDATFLRLLQQVFSAANKSGTLKKKMLTPAVCHTDAIKMWHEVLNNRHDGLRKIDSWISRCTPSSTTLTRSHIEVMKLLHGYGDDLRERRHHGRQEGQHRGGAPAGRRGRGPDGARRRRHHDGALAQVYSGKRILS